MEDIAYLNNKYAPLENGTGTEEGRGKPAVQPAL